MDNDLQYLLGAGKRARERNGARQRSERAHEKWNSIPNLTVSIAIGRWIEASYAGSHSLGNINSS